VDKGRTFAVRPNSGHVQHSAHDVEDLTCSSTSAPRHAGQGAAEVGRLHGWIKRPQYLVWSSAQLLIGSGVVAAAQIGKAIISIPMIRADMAFGLDLAGLIVALLATLGALFGLGAGVLVRRSGVRRSLIVGMGAIACGNLIGAAAPNEFVLLTARIVEGAGFFATVLAIASILT
jgi:MFS family permease